MVLLGLVQQLQLESTLNFLKLQVYAHTVFFVMLTKPGGVKLTTEFFLIELDIIFSHCICFKTQFVLHKMRIF